MANVFLKRVLPGIILLILVCFSAFSAERGLRNVRIGYGALPGFHEQTAAGVRSGYGYEYLQRIAARASWHCEYVGYEKSWSELQKMLENGEIDILSCVNKTPEREKKFAFSANPSGLSFVNLTVKAGNTSFASGNYQAWKGMRVGMVRGNSLNEVFDAWADGKGFQYTRVFFDSDIEVSAALQDGRIDSIVSINFRRLEQ